MIHITWTCEDNFILSAKALAIPRIGDIVSFTEIGRQGKTKHKIDGFESFFEVQFVDHYFYFDHELVHNIENHVVHISLIRVTEKPKRLTSPDDLSC